MGRTVLADGPDLLGRESRVPVALAPGAEAPLSPGGALLGRHSYYLRLRVHITAIEISSRHVQNSEVPSSGTRERLAMILNFVFWEVVSYWRIPAQHSNQIVSPMRRELLALLLFTRPNLQAASLEARILL